MIPGRMPRDGEPRNAASTALMFVIANMNRGASETVYPSTWPSLDRPAMRRCSASYAGAVIMPANTMLAQRSMTSTLAEAGPRFQFSLLFKSRSMLSGLCPVVGAVP